jgi:hypothetical protein
VAVKLALLRSNTCFMHGVHRTGCFAPVSTLDQLMLGFPPGHSTVVFCDLLFVMSIPSLLPFRIDQASIPHDIPILLSPDPFIMSITDQITDSLLDLCTTFALHSKPTLLLLEKYATIPRSSLVAAVSARVANLWRFPCVIPSRGDYSSVSLSHSFIAVAL